MYLLRIWYNLFDPAAEDAIYDSYAIRRFTGIDFMTESVLNEATRRKFRHLLAASRPNKLSFDVINRVMVQTRHMMKGGTIVDAKRLICCMRSERLDTASFASDAKSSLHKRISTNI